MATSPDAEEKLEEQRTGQQGGDEQRFPAPDPIGPEGQVSPFRQADLDPLDRTLGRQIAPGIADQRVPPEPLVNDRHRRSEEPPSELQALLRISYSVSFLTQTQTR